MDALAADRPWRDRSWPSAALVAVVVGMVIGALTFVGQRFMPGQWNTLVNSGAIWLVPVFFVGSRMRSLPWAAAAGVATLLATLAGYYVPSTLAGTPHSAYFVALWVGVALIAGLLFGVAGCAWRSDRRMYRVVGVAMLGGVIARSATRSVRSRQSTCRSCRQGNRRLRRLEVTRTVHVPSVAPSMESATCAWPTMVAGVRYRAASDSRLYAVNGHASRGGDPIRRSQ